MKKEKKKHQKDDHAAAQPKNFQAAFYSNYDGTIVLDSADEAYLRLIGCTKNDIGRNIRDILGENEYKRLKYYADSYRGYIFRLKYMTGFAGAENRLWKVNAKVNYPVIECRGRMIETDDTAMYSLPEPRSAGYEADDKGTVIFSKKEKGFYIEFCSDNVEKKFPHLSAGKYLCGNVTKIEKLLDECITCGKKISCYDTDVSGENKRAMFHVNASPVHCMETRAAAVEILFLNSRKYEKTYRFENESDELFGKNIIGSAVISCRTPENVYFSDINPYLARLIRNGKITKKDIVDSHPFRSAVHERLSGFGRIEIALPDGSMQDYILGAVPLIENGVTVRAFVFVISTENRDMLDISVFDKLTLRESNVLRLAAEGMDSKKIGQALNISEGTAKRELFGCYKKLGVNNKIGIIKKLYHI